MAASMMSTFALAGVNVTAVASRDPERGRRFANAFAIPSASDSLSSILLSDEVDAVYIANSTADHARTAIAALEAGKAVLCEKPLATTVNEAERITEASRRSGQLCMEGIWTLFLPAYRRFFELARSNICGEPNYLFADFGYPVRASSRVLSPTVGGVLLDRGVYVAALAIKLFGPIEKTSFGLRFNAEGLNDHASLQLIHSAGGQCQLAVSFSSLMSNTATLACSGGALRLEQPLIGAETVSIQMAYHERDADWNPTQPFRLRDKIGHILRERPWLRRLKRALPNIRREHLSYGPDKYLPQLIHFLDLQERGAQESDVVPLELSLAIQRLIARAPGTVGADAAGILER
jgi:predicted dehydrogenase